MRAPQHPPARCARPVPELVPPMLAAPGPLPDGGDWVVEFAWEGLRCLAHVRPDRARLRTSTAAT